MKTRLLTKAIAVITLSVVSLGAAANPLNIDLPTLSLPSIEMPEVISEMSIESVSFDGFWDETAEEIIADASAIKDEAQ